MRLYIIYFFACLAVWLSSYYPGLDLFLSALFLLIIAIEAQQIKRLPLVNKILLGIAWQLPGLVLSLILFTGWDILGIFDYAIFLLGFWGTPVIPLLSILPGGNLVNPCYYYFLLITPFLLFIYYIICGCLKINPPAEF